MNSTTPSDDPPKDPAAPYAGRVRARFGEAVDPGFFAVPVVLTLHQVELGLSSEEVNVLLNLLTHWYDPERMPFPSARTIAKRMGVSERTVQRLLLRMCRKELISKTKTLGYRGYDLRPLVDKLVPFARKRRALFPRPHSDDSINPSGANHVSSEIGIGRATLG